MRTVGVMMLVLGAALAGTARAHDDGELERKARFEATLVSDADAGDLQVGSVSGSFVQIDGDSGGDVRMALAHVTDGNAPADAVRCGLTVTGLVGGAPFTTTLPFAVVAGAAQLHGTLGFAVGAVVEVQTVAAACDPAGVFAVPGVRGSAGDHDELVAADHHHGRGDGGHGDGGHGARGHGGGRGTLVTSLVGDADTGDYTLDSAMGSFLTIDGEEGGAVAMNLAGVRDGGTPVDHTGNQLVITGLRNGTPFTATFPFALVGGFGTLRGTLALAAGDVLEIQTIAVTDGTTTFAVPGFLVHDDGDDDGVGDDGDRCAGTDPTDQVGNDGCSMNQSCPCDAGRDALRACLKSAAKDVRSHLRASCGKGRSCRHVLRSVAMERRQLLRACPK